MKSYDEQTPIRRAVEWLKKQRRIRRDNDLVDLFQLEKSTISTYLNGTPGIDFEKKFEEKFKISLRDFEDQDKSTTMNTEPNNHPNQPEPFSMGTIEQMTKTSADLSETNANLSAATKETALANRILAENQRELIAIIKGIHLPIANAAKEIPVEYPSESTLQVMAARGILHGLWSSMDEGLDKLGKLCDEGVLIKKE